MAFIVSWPHWPVLFLASLVLLSVQVPLGAASSPRRLALLVGIDQYWSPQIRRLGGAVNDTALMRELLVYKYGFKLQDIRILTDAQATRKNILAEFERHLISQARPGDVVVFHFSGHGGQVRDLDGDETEDRFDETIVPVDSPAIGTGGTGRATRDITDDTVGLLLQALKTENVTVIFDSCHSGSGTRGNDRRVRALPGGADRDPAPEETQFNRQITLTHLKIPRHGLPTRTDGTVNRFDRGPRGVFLAGAQAFQGAIDGQFGTTRFGTFTYHLTRSLWRARPGASYEEVAELTTNAVSLENKSQIPSFEPSRPGLGKRPFFFVGDAGPAASAVVTADRSADLVPVWLGGLGVRAELGERFYALDGRGGKVGELELVSIDKHFPLKGRAKVLSGAASAGSALEEAAYFRRTRPVLSIAVSPPELATEATAITSERSWLRWVPRGEEAQLYLERGEGGFQLSWKDGTLIETPELQGAAGLSVVIERLLPKFRNLTARQVLLDASERGLGVEQVYTIEQEVYVVGSKVEDIEAGRGRLLAAGAALKPGEVSVWWVRNRSQSPLYLNALVVSSKGELTTLKEIPLPAGATEFVSGRARGDTGVGEVLLVLSAASQQQALDALKQNLRRAPGKEGLSASSPFAVARLLLEEANERGGAGTDSTRAGLDLDSFEAFSSGQVELKVNAGYLRVEPRLFRVESLAK
ncbi:MAG: caspase family protein [Gemmatimonadaceae bacterium]|nr:caspase family protein [Gloeobacterales cyanobacterium ES-bin-141]